MDSVMTKFNIGDIVTVKKTAEKGEIVDIVSKLGGDDNLYEVQIDSHTRLYNECYLDGLETTKKTKEKVEIKEEVKNNIKDEKISNDIKNINVNDVNLSFEIEDEINRIIEELGLVKVNKDTDSLIDSCKLLKYLATRECNISKKECKTGNLILNELYKGLINREDNYITNSYLFSEILKRLGVDVYNVGLKDDNGNFYMANLVLIKGQYYYFDVTVEQAIFNSTGRDINKFKLCSACIGGDTYHQYFKPISIIEINPNNTSNKIEVPTNISKKDMDPKILNKIIGVDI